METNLHKLNAAPSINNFTELNQKLNSIQNLILECYDIACPLRKHKADQSVPYYTSEDRKMRKTVRKAFNRARSPNSTCKGIIVAQ